MRIGMKAVVVAVIAVMAAGFLCSCDSYSTGTVSGQINLLESRTSMSNGAQDSTYTVRHDDQGNCLLIIEEYKDKHYEYPLTYDSNGYLMTWGSSDQGLTVLVGNTFDDLGRLVASEFDMPDISDQDDGRFIATYTYYEDSLDIATIAYRFEGESYSEYYIDRICPYVSQYRDVSYGTMRIANGSEFYVNYSREGLLISYGTADDITEVQTPSRDELKNKVTKNEYQSGSSTLYYDANGYLAKMESTSTYNGATTSYTTEYEYKAITSPSPATAVFMRLMS